MMTECLKFETFADYFGGSLSDEDKIQMMDHISSCSECLEQFASANEVMNNPELEEWEPASDQVTRGALKKLNLSVPDETREPWSQPVTNHSPQAATNRQQTTDNKPQATFWLRESAERIKEWAGALFNVPQPVLVRSDSESVADRGLSSEIAGFGITINLEALYNDNAIIKVTLQKGQEIPENISFMLIGANGNLFARNLIKEAAQFDDIPFDTYQLIIEQNGVEKGTSVFEISETGIYERELTS